MRVPLSTNLASCLQGCDARILCLKRNDLRGKSTKGMPPPIDSDAHTVREGKFAGLT
jgi:hypothetical protein